jgi:hypothetical protein
MRIIHSMFWLARGAKTRKFGARRFSHWLTG